jgi:hypothetical protein
LISLRPFSDQAAERDAGEDVDEEMGQAKTAVDLQKEAANKEEVFKAKKKARLEKPNSANDKGTLLLLPKPQPLPIFMTVVLVSGSGRAEHT